MYIYIYIWFLKNNSNNKPKKEKIGGDSFPFFRSVQFGWRKKQTKETVHSCNTLSLLPMPLEWETEFVKLSCMKLWKSLINCLYLGLNSLHSMYTLPSILWSMHQNNSTFCCAILNCITAVHILIPDL